MPHTTIGENTGLSIKLTVGAVLISASIIMWLNARFTALDQAVERQRVYVEAIHQDAMGREQFRTWREEFEHQNPTVKVPTLQATVSKP